MLVTKLCPALCDSQAAAHQAPLSMEFSRQEYWSGWPCPPPGGFPNPGIKPMFLTSSALEGGFFTTSATWEAPKGSSTDDHLWLFANMCLASWSIRNIGEQGVLVYGVFFAIFFIFLNLFFICISLLYNVVLTSAV